MFWSVFLSEAILLRMCKAKKERLRRGVGKKESISVGWQTLKLPWRRGGSGSQEDQRGKGQDSTGGKRR
jgi:hypothetical protein